MTLDIGAMARQAIAEALVSGEEGRLDRSVYERLLRSLAGRRLTRSQLETLKSAVGAPSIGGSTNTPNFASP